MLAGNVDASYPDADLISEIPILIDQYDTKI